MKLIIITVLIDYSEILQVKSAKGRDSQAKVREIPRNGAPRSLLPMELTGLIFSAIMNMQSNNHEAPEPGCLEFGHINMVDCPHV